MIRQFIGVTRRAQKNASSYVLRANFSSVQTEEWSLFPREREGNEYAVNWSLCEDGVVPVGDAYRNARLPLLTTKLGAKVQGGKVDAKAPAYSGTFALSEAGDNMSHDAFSELFTAQQDYLSSGIDLFVEDAALGASKSTRNGVRVVTDSPAVALIARSLLIPTPPVALNHRARFKGWNFDPRWLPRAPAWNGSGYDLPADATVAEVGQRPVVAFVGGDGDAVAVQFVEDNEEIVGANVIVGGAAPVSGLVDAIGHATTVLLNAQAADAVALPSTSLVKGEQTAVILGADESVVDAAAQSGMLYGAYHNVLSAEGVSALWNGYLGSASTAGSSSSTPQVAVDGKAVVTCEPNNLAFPATHVIIYEKGAKKSKLSADEATKKLVEMTDDSKEAVIKAILNGLTVSVIGKASDVKSIF